MLQRDDPFAVLGNPAANRTVEIPHPPLENEIDARSVDLDHARALASRVAARVAWPRWLDLWRDHRSPPEIHSAAFLGSLGVPLRCVLLFR